MSKNLSSKRAKARAAATQRRQDNRDWRRKLLDLVAAGHGYETIAAHAKVSVSTIKREVKRALDQRPPEPADTFVALQRERLNKALQYTDLALERGDMRAVPALVSLLPHLERYWRLQTALAGAGGAQLSAPNPLKSLELETEFPPRAVAPASAPQP